MRASGEEEADNMRGNSPDDGLPADRLAVRGVVGFDVAADVGGVRQGLMLRHGSELYGRPVYESEDGGQFLYWLREGGSLRDGAESELYAAGEAGSAEALRKT